MEREKGWKGERGARSRWRHRVCCLYEEIEGTEQQGESLHHLFMRSEMIPELVCVCVAFGLKRPTVCQWGRDLGLRSRLENAPPTEWTLLLFNEPPLFGFGLLIYRILCKVSRPFRFFLFSPFLVIGAGQGGGGEDVQRESRVISSIGGWNRGWKHFLHSLRSKLYVLVFNL